MNYSSRLHLKNMSDQYTCAWKFLGLQDTDQVDLMVPGLPFFTLRWSSKTFLRLFYVWLHQMCCIQCITLHVLLFSYYTCNRAKSVAGLSDLFGCVQMLLCSDHLLVCNSCQELIQTNSKVCVYQELWCVSCVQLSHEALFHVVIKNRFLNCHLKVKMTEYIFI